MDGTDLPDIPSVEEGRVFLRDLETEPASNVPERMNDGEDILDFKGIVTAKKVATSGIRGKFKEVQHICENVCEAVPMTTVEVIVLAREGVEVKRKNAILSDRNTSLKGKLMEVRTF